MALSEARKKANEKYTKNNYDEIKLRVPKGKKELIKEYAESRSESVNGYINRLIDEDIVKGAN